jgi:ribokinase
VRDGPTDESIIYLAASGENTIVSISAMARSITPEDVSPVLQALQRGDFLLMQGNLTELTTRSSLERAHTNGCTTILNPAPIDYSYDAILGQVDYLILNEVESRTLSGESDPTHAARRLLKSGSLAIITTLGKDGVLVATPNGTTHYPAPQVPAVDTTGAGDVFCGVLAAALTRGLPLTVACPWAVHAATLSVTRRGTLTSFPISHELEAVLRDITQKTAFPGKAGGTYA